MTDQAADVAARIRDAIVVGRSRTDTVEGILQVIADAGLVVVPATQEGVREALIRFLDDQIRYYTNSPAYHDRVIEDHLSNLEQWKILVSAWPAVSAGEPDLMTLYMPTLVKFDEPPRLEYVINDAVHIYNPVDERFFYITDMETRKIVGFQFMLPRSPQPIPPLSERKGFSLKGTGFTLKECGCTEGFCDQLTDGTCRLASPKDAAATAVGAHERNTPRTGE